MKTKTPKLKARRMWANVYTNGLGYFYESKKKAVAGQMTDAIKTIPIVFIPLDDVEGLVEKAYDAYLNGPGSTMKDGVRDMLTAIGVLPKQRKKGGRK